MDYNREIAKPTFCVAPWMETHISVEGKIMPCCIYDEKNPFGNFKNDTLEEAYNSDRAKQARKDLTSGIKHDGCSRCWRQEELTGESYRTRHNEFYGETAIAALMNTKPDFSIQPLVLKRLDLRFDNKCNLKCRICSPLYSTSWHADAKKMKEEFNSGPYMEPGVDNIRENNPYEISVSDQNFQTLLETLPNVFELFFAGGEPLIQDRHYEILQYCIDNDLAKKMSITYNTNFSKLKYKQHNVIDYWKHFEHVSVSTSLDDSKSRGEYQRTNISWEQVIKNRKEIIPYSNIDFQIAPTISIFNVFHILDFIEEWIDNNLLTVNKNVGLHINMLEYPKIYNIINLPNEYKNKIIDAYNDFNEKHKSDERYKYVFSKLDTVTSWLRLERTMEVKEWYDKFLEFNSQLDKIRNENFYEVFPEYSNIKKVI